MFSGFTVDYEYQGVLWGDIAHWQLEHGDVALLVQYQAVGAIAEFGFNGERVVHLCGVSLLIHNLIDGSHDVLHRTVDAGAGNV